MENNEIGKRIKACRLALNLTQQDFSAQLKISRSHLSNIENGNEKPSKSVVFILSVLYGINENWVINGKGEMFDSSRIAEKEGLYHEVHEKISRKMQSSNLLDNEIISESLNIFANILSNANSNEKIACFNFILEYINEAFLIIDNETNKENKDKLRLIIMKIQDTIMELYNE